VRTGSVSFVGAGPGAADLITLRGVRRLAEADVVVWAPSLIDSECVREHTRPDAELVDSSRVGAEEIVELFRRAARDKLKVARLHAGDPVLWGSVRDQYEACRRIGVEVEIVPGVSQISAAASAVGRELTDGDQSMILTKVDATALPDATQIREFAKHGATMGVFVAAARTGQLVEELTEGGYAEDTPVVVAYKTTWPDELLLNTTLGELEAVVKQRKLWRHTLFLVGKAMSVGSKPRYRRTESADQVEDSAAAQEAGEASKAPRRTAWSARAGRTNRIAAARAEVPGQVNEDAPASEAAWRAVHGWQASAARSAVKPVPAVKPKKQDVDQQSLEIVSEADDQRAPVSAAAIAAPARTSVVVPEAKEIKETKETKETQETKTVRTAAGQKKPAVKPRAKQAQRTRKSG
jgi:precorrin-4/cobalt-precorrin-4 C11-methyltransferase